MEKRVRDVPANLGVIESLSENFIYGQSISAVQDQR
jgi:hypothetical protein